MLVVMQTHAADSDVARVVEVIKGQGLTPHVLPGATRTAIGVTGNTGAVEPTLFEGLPGVEEAIRVTRPYKLASREMKRDDTVIPLRQGTIGPDTFTVIEKWESVEALRAHGAAPHMAAYAAKTQDLVAERAIYVLSEA